MKDGRTTSAASGSTGSAIKPVYGVYGADEFLRTEAIGRITRDVLGDRPEPMAISDYDGTKASLAEVLDDVRTLPFFGGVRLVIVRDADDLITKHREALERYVAAPSETGVLVLICTSLNKQWRLTRAIEKVGKLVECKAPSPRERPTWLITRARQHYGKTLEPPAAATLVELVGDDMAGLDGELAKLSIYVGDRATITENDVGELVGYHRPENVFRMTDALAAKNAPVCLKVWRQTLATDNQAEFRAIGGLAWAVRQMIVAKDGSKPTTNWSMSKSAGRFTLRQLQDILVQLLAADVAGKTGLGTVETAIEKLIVRSCTAR